MKRVLAALAVVAFLAAPAAAQSKLDQAIAKADEQLVKGKPDDAVKTLTKAAAEAGAEGQLALARLHERIGDLEAAAKAYEQAKGSATGAARADALAAVANFTLRRGKATDALAIAKQAVEAGATPAALAAMARAQVRTEDAPGALATADKAVAAGSGSAIAQIARGEALIAMGKNAEAEAALRQAIQIDPKSALAYSRLARAQLALAQPADAVASAKKATELDDKFGEGFAILGVAIVAENPKSWSDAIAQAQQGAFLDPDNPIVQGAVGKIFEANGQLEQAAGAYRKALAADPAFGPARFALIQAELNRGNRDAAIAEAKKLAAGGMSSADIERLIGEDAVRRQDYAGAIPFLEKATKGLPGNPDGWALLGRAYHANRRYDEAADAYKKAVELAPQNANYRTTYGLILGMAGELDAGLAELQKVTRHARLQGRGRLGQPRLDLPQHEQGPRSRSPPTRRRSRSTPRRSRPRSASAGPTSTRRSTTRRSRPTTRPSRSTRRTPRPTPTSASRGATSSRSRCPRPARTRTRRRRRGAASPSSRRTSTSSRRRSPSGPPSPRSRWRRRRPSSRPTRSAPRRSRPRTTPPARRTPRPARGPRATSPRSPGRAPCPRSSS